MAINQVIDAINVVGMTNDLLSLYICNFPQFLEHIPKGSRITQKVLILYDDNDAWLGLA